jgi:hypothetical protein
MVSHGAAVVAIVVVDSLRDVVFRRTTLKTPLREFVSEIFAENGKKAEKTKIFIT